MIMFWIVAALIAAGAAVLMAQTAARAASADGDDPARSVYRRQLAELDDLVARGLMSEADLQTTRAETGRRLLRLSQAPATAGTARSSPLAITLAAAAPPLLALAAYVLLGQPGTPDQPFAQRLAAWRAADPRTLDAAQMAAILQSMTASRPRDPTLYRNLALAELASGDAAGAVQAMRHAVAAAPGDPTLQVSLGEALMMQNQNRLNPAASRALAEALRLRPGMPEARYMLARGHIAGGDLAGGLAEWRALLADLPASDERRAGLAQQIEAVTRWGGLTPPASEAPRGGMDAAIRGMVAGLAARLQNQPDDPQGWIRLVRAYTVLHEIPAREAALETARARYRGRPDILRGLDEATRAPAP
jgi:cytochrome c-type biogenesis protein CcmH